MAGRASRVVFALLAGSAIACAGPRGEPAPDDDIPGDDGVTRPDAGGSDDDGAAGHVPVHTCDDEAPTVGVRPMLRLTPTQYRNTMRDLLGLPELQTGFDDDAAVPTERGIRQLQADAEALVADVAQWRAGLVPCDLNGPEDAACPDAVIDALAPRAFRRPLSPEQRAWLSGVYEAARAEQDFRSAMEALLATILQAPALLYLEPTGTPVDGAADTVRALDDHAIASRLSYFLWDTMPDDALMDAAAAGELSTREAIAAQVQRMLADPRAEAKVQAVVHAWLGLDGGPVHFALEDQTKDVALFPDHSPAFVASMKAELEAFVARTLLQGGTIADLLVGRDAYVDATMADHYRVPGPLDDSRVWVQLDASTHAGVLTRAAFLSTHADRDVQSPIRRGAEIYENILCGVLGDPPPGADNSPVQGGEVDGEIVTVRQAVEARTQGTECRGCHDIINNIGFAFGHYDAIGHWQPVELITGAAIDSSGRLIGTDVDGEVADALELSARLADSAMVRRCFARRWFAAGVGQAPAAEDQCSVQRIDAAILQADTLPALLEAIATSDAFRHVDLGEGAP